MSHSLCHYSVCIHWSVLIVLIAVDCYTVGSHPPVQSKHHQTEQSQTYKVDLHTSEESNRLETFGSLDQFIKEGNKSFNKICRRRREEQEQEVEEVTAEWRAQTCPPQWAGPAWTASSLIGQPSCSSCSWSLCAFWSGFHLSSSPAAGWPETQSMYFSQYLMFWTRLWSTYIPAVVPGGVCSRGHRRCRPALLQSFSSTGSSSSWNSSHTEILFSETQSGHTHTHTHTHTQYVTVVIRETASLA